MFLFQGNVEVELGNENLVFQGGPFMYFGTQVLAGEQCRKMGTFLKAGNCFDFGESSPGRIYLAKFFQYSLFEVNLFPCFSRFLHGIQRPFR